jgi:hypothetical protein
MTKRAIISLAILIATFIVIYTQLTIFVVPPIENLPGGMTIVFPRLSETNFIDSPDAMCERNAGQISLRCRVTTLGAVAAKARIVARMPYSVTLYRMSTHGNHSAK